MTLEEAQDKILTLNEELKTSKETLSTLNETIKNNDTLIKDKDQEIEKLKEHNMKLFLKVASDEKILDDPKDPGDPGDPKSDITSWDNFKIDLNK